MTHHREGVLLVQPVEQQVQLSLALAQSTISRVSAGASFSADSKMREHAASAPRCTRALAPSTSVRSVRSAAGASASTALAAAAAAAAHAHAADASCSCRSALSLSALPAAALRSSGAADSCTAGRRLRGLRVASGRAATARRREDGTRPVLRAAAAFWRDARASGARAGAVAACAIVLADAISNGRSNAEVVVAAGRWRGVKVVLKSRGASTAASEARSGVHPCADVAYRAAPRATTLVRVRRQHACEALSAAAAGPRTLRSEQSPRRAPPRAPPPPPRCPPRAPAGASS
jgi:hypothetical protein